MRINLRNFTEQEELPLENVKNVISLEYDLQDGCIFYGDTNDRKIYKQCLNGSMVETLVQKTDTVEGNNKKIFTVFENHRKSRIQHCERSELTKIH